MRADLLIKNGKIAKIAGEISPEKGMRVINGKGLCIYPGSIDAHSHIGSPRNREPRRRTHPMRKPIRLPIHTGD